MHIGYKILLKPNETSIEDKKGRIKKKGKLIWTLERIFLVIAIDVQGMKTYFYMDIYGTDPPQNILNVLKIEPILLARKTETKTYPIHGDRLRSKKQL